MSKMNEDWRMKLSSFSVFTQYMLYITEHIFNGVLCFSHSLSFELSKLLRRLFLRRRKNENRKAKLENRKTKLTAHV